MGSDEKRAQAHRSTIGILFHWLRHSLRSLLVFQGQGLAESMLVNGQVESIATYLRQPAPQTHPGEGYPPCHNRKRKSVSVGPCLRCEVIRVTEDRLVVSPTPGDNYESQSANGKTMEQRPDSPLSNSNLFLLRLINTSFILPSTSRTRLCPRTLDLHGPTSLTP